MTKLWVIDPVQKADLTLALAEAAEMLQWGETVAFPTETVYGLGADATNTEAVRRIYEAKGRPSDNPLIVHLADRDQLASLMEGEVPQPLATLMERFWPGPLTVIVPVRQGAVSPLVTAGLSTVGVRIPDNPVARALIRLADRPIAAPSANSSGRPSPTTAEHVREDLTGRIGGIVDGGPAGVGVESTVVEWADDALHILRPGGVTAEALQAALPGVPVRTAAAPAGADADADPALARQAAPQPDGSAASSPPRAPGMKYRHYAPRGRMWLVDGDDPAAVATTIRRELRAASQRGERTGVLTFAERSALYEEADLVVACGSLREPQSIAQGLFAALRRFDQDGVTHILAECCPEEGIGAAVMNRLRKAAGGRVLRAD